MESTLDLKTEDLNPNDGSTTYLGKLFLFHLLKNAYRILPPLCQAVSETRNTEMNKTYACSQDILQQLVGRQTREQMLLAHCVALGSCLTSRTPVSFPVKWVIVPMPQRCHQD